MNEWNVMVSGVGFIGTVHEKTEDLARCAALSKFSADGCRPPLTGSLPLPYIYGDDDFSVSKRGVW